MKIHNHVIYFRARVFLIIKHVKSSDTLSQFYMFGAKDKIRFKSKLIIIHSLVAFVCL